ncbi:MAG: hydroxyacid dehydrogenase [Candidatus Kaiserbacteria bacterium GW2011_GWA2_49_19]|uniref:Hydroxyacid dehydrogenase n=2 Tax=Candidatus Kaiseribacteriota TaxID=1752734 RepID=A0A0G1VPR1_9BACT|nr:MAG: hydroxyacid dehydrogenase [Candidatus Kaiserbacteria bacterium GW2011_GWA2_49_19]
MWQNINNAKVGVWTGIQYNSHMKVLIFSADEAARSILSPVLMGHTAVFFDEIVSLHALKENSDAEAVSIFTSSEFKKEQIDALPNLKCISTRSTGYDHIDTAYAKEKGIVVCNVPRYGAKTVAEFTFALILTLSRRIFEAFHQVREEGSFKTSALEGFNLFGKTLGVVGTGNIGRNVVGIAKGFGMKVLMMDPYPDNKLEDEQAKYAPLDELLAGSDIVTLHVPYTKENRYLLNKDSFAKMKRGAFIINTARGELVDTEALLDALKSGQVAGAGLDVLEEERVLKDEVELVKGIESMNELKILIRDHALIDMPRVVITPHIAFFSREACHEILEVTAANITGFVAGKPTNIVAS